MSDQSDANPNVVKPDAPPAGASLQPKASPAVRDPIAANALSPEEQMALFEKELKENDWGHQPC